MSKLVNMPEGCRRPLAEGQWYACCGAREFDSMPVLCTECGGEFILKDPSPKLSANIKPCIKDN